MNLPKPLWWEVTWQLMMILDTYLAKTSILCSNWFFTLTPITFQTKYVVPGDLYLWLIKTSVSLRRLKLNSWEVIQFNKLNYKVKIINRRKNQDSHYSREMKMFHDISRLKLSLSRKWLKINKLTCACYHLNVWLVNKCSHLQVLIDYIATEN